MHYGLKLISPPDSEPITLEEAKHHLRLEYDFTDDDAYISSLITAARRYTEGWTSNLFMNQGWLMTLDAFPCANYGEIVIPLRPVTEVYAIEYLDDAGVKQTLAATSYRVDVNNFLTRIRPAYGESWPSTRAEIGNVEIRFTAGYENEAGGVPEHLKQGLLLLIGHLYENREDSVIGVSVQSLPRGYDALVGIDRVMGV